jgi:ABC-type Mn2+/Zn2+ transport system permease subunit
MLVTRAASSWNYLSIMFGFVLSIEGQVISMAPLHWPSNVIVYAAGGGFTTLLFFGSGWFQKKMIGLKGWYETNRAVLIFEAGCA